MNHNWDIIGDKIFGILRGNGYRVQMFDRGGDKTMDPHEATRYFVTIPSNDPALKNFNILISLHDEDTSSHMDIKTPDLADDKDFNNVIKIKDSLQNNIGDREGLSVNWYKFDHDIDPREDAVNNIKEHKSVAAKIAEDSNKCPPATQNITLNLKNRQKAIDEYGYGPLNPDLPNTKFWMKKVDEWNLDSAKDAKQSLCGNCAAFDQRTETLNCIAKGIDSDNPTDAAATIDAGNLGYCKFLKFKCASRRTCDAWVTGGPLTDSKQMNESKDISKAYGSTKSSYQKIGNSKLVIRHTDPVNEEKKGSRWRHIKNIFIETKLGERFNYPHPHIAGARAMARHLANDGKFNDQVSKAILKMSEDYIKLKKANGLMRGKDPDLSLQVKTALQKLSKDSKRLSGSRGYATGIADIAKQSMLAPAERVIELRNKLAETCGCQQGDDHDLSSLETAARYLISNGYTVSKPEPEADPMDIEILRLEELAGLI